MGVLPSAPMGRSEAGVVFRARRLGVLEHDTGLVNRRENP